MTDIGPDFTPAERRIAVVISRVDRMLAATVSDALEKAIEQAAHDLRAIGQEGATPVLQYFAGVVHQQMYCLMCGADPDTLQGGDPDIAYYVIRNSQNIAKHYWSADIEPYPAK
ncbi:MULTISPECIES: hypothetical protein [Hyphomicrobiales]|jgi:hypothetical protein|uniref:Uncharacterized protein n=2 Tax=Hyphomicrobiales TaxID=356 RepID=A0A546XF01_AGRTU|nr:MULTISPECIES: hypothetical protein [Hyphomicrobiales]KAB2788708.1 hypothetical protein F9K96_16850 [Brucella anthropi]MBE0563563.1 hypothetical protein [Brucella anthropi]MBQ0708006.1 hypothetical protein [Ochrobactrum sp. AP1BH01-1]TRA99300.1 hypothetical protein EXN61_26305 [Agrobacterium tumefaciens]